MYLELFLLDVEFLLKLTNLVKQRIELRLKTIVLLRLLG